MSRVRDRKEFNTDTRVTLLESDADDLEITVAHIQRSMSRLSTTFIGAAITFGTSAVLLAANLVIS